MREIKFRAWDTEEKGMLEFLSASQDNNRLSLQPSNDRYILLQYTGLKDRNGKEIFEGDIVKQQLTQHFDKRGGAREKREWDFVGQIIWADDVCGFSLDGKDPREVLDSFSRIINDEPCEVIGNIYENGDLLNPSNLNTEEAK